MRTKIINISGLATSFLFVFKVLHLTQMVQQLHSEHWNYIKVSVSDHCVLQLTPQKDCSASRSNKYSVFDWWNALWRSSIQRAFGQTRLYMVQSCGFSKGLGFISSALCFGPLRPVGGDQTQVLGVGFFETRVLSWTPGPDGYLKPCCLCSVSKVAWRKKFKVISVDEKHPGDRRQFNYGPKPP